MSTVRQEQIQGRLVEEISSMVRRDLKDPRIGFVTITGARITRDLRSAQIYVSIMGDDEARTQTMAVLKTASGWMRGEFARRAHLRLAPELDFRYDEGVMRAARVFELLNQIKEEDQERAAGAAETAGTGLDLEPGA